MKTLILAFMLATITGAQAQKAINLVNDKTGEIVGTATLTGRTFYLRDLKGELIGTISVEKDNKNTLRDPSGKIVESLPLPMAGGPVKLPDEP